MLIDSLRSLGVRAVSRPQDELASHTFAGQQRKVCLPVTFTPFASAKPCSARCIFCSETLQHVNSTKLSATIRPGAYYFRGLEAALNELDGLPVGVSLSGLEATDDAPWLCTVLDWLQYHEARTAGNVTDKVLYTNGNGLCASTTGDVLIPRLVEYGLTRAEFSRHHYDGNRNQQIMRFRPDMPVKDQSVWADTARLVGSVLPVRLVCIVQQRGVNSADEVQKYLEWASTQLNPMDVVLREFSDTKDQYRPNGTLRVIEKERVSVEQLLIDLLQGPHATDYEPILITRGYYFWNVQMRWRNRLDVTFEASDYGAMKECHSSDVVYKLVYHANGNLCADWDPNTSVLLRTEQ